MIISFPTAPKVQTFCYIEFKEKRDTKISMTHLVE